MSKRKTEDIVETISLETARRVPEMIREHLKQIILFGSYARGDYTEESDIDIAILVDCDRKDTSRYADDLIRLSSEMDLSNMVVDNFICLPYLEFIEKKSYYPFYSNIEKEGRIIYG